MYNSVDFDIWVSHWTDCKSRVLTFTSLSCRCVISAVVIQFRKVLRKFSMHFIPLVPLRLPIVIWGGFHVHNLVHLLLKAVHPSQKAGYTSSGNGILQSLTHKPRNEDCQNPNNRVNHNGESRRKTKALIFNRVLCIPHLECIIWPIRNVHACVPS